MRILIIQIPAQTAEDILPGLKEHIKFSTTLLTHPVNITLQIPLGIPSTDDRNLGLKQLRQRLLPLMRASRVTQTRVEEHKAIQVRIEGTEILRLFHSVEVVHVGSDLHLATESVLDDAAEGVLRCALGKRILSVSIRHALRSDEDEVQQSAGVHVLQLQPDVAGEGRLCAGAENEDSYWGRLQAETFDVDAFTGFRGVEGVAEGTQTLQSLRCEPSIGTNTVRAKLVQDTADCLGVG